MAHVEAQFYELNVSAMICDDCRQTYRLSQSPVIDFERMSDEELVKATPHIVPVCGQCFRAGS